MSIHHLNVDPILKIFKNSAFPFLDAQLSECADFEMRMGDCLEAYGLHRGAKACEDYIADMRECVLNGKQKQRVKHMRIEHIEQHKAGKKPQRWEKSPFYDAY